MSNIFAGSAEFVREAEVKYNDDMRNEIQKLIALGITRGEMDRLFPGGLFRMPDLDLAKSSGPKVFDAVYWLSMCASVVQGAKDELEFRAQANRWVAFTASPWADKHGLANITIRTTPVTACRDGYQRFTSDQGPQGSVIVHGIPLQLVSQQNQFFNKPFTPEGGMSPGLPLATAQSSQRGLLCSGTISGMFS